MKVLILAGGKGTRAYPYTEYLPKPMMPIGGKPVITRVMEIFARQGIKEFVVSLGYRKEVITDYFEGRSSPWKVDLIDTGENTDTGGRIYKARHLLGDRFMATYTDGLCDVPLAKLLAFHEKRVKLGGLATITSVPLVSQYGTIEANDDGQIVAFREKPTLYEHWINAGFFVMEKAIFRNWQGENLEREVFPALQKKGRLYTYQHRGFFKSMDTYKDQQEIETLCETGKMPWLVPVAGKGSKPRTKPKAARRT
ncbi:MAG: NTP transferase domain-containing protein [Alphaproteobacteria bacterium]|nr:NTP transferase domain-containing protein [Alphaproteobacteria bacterium]